MDYYTTLHQYQSQKSVNNFYQKAGQNVSCHRHDRIAISTKSPIDNDNNPLILGAGFIRQYNDSFILRSLYVEESVRGCGVAKSIISALLSNFSEPVYLRCDETLNPLYLPFGFKPTSELPQAAPQIFTKQKKGQNLLFRPNNNNIG